MSGPSERYGVTGDDVDTERVRPSMLAETPDQGTFRLLEQVRVEAGAAPEPDAATALEQTRAPGFAMLGPTSIATFRRKPA